MKNITLLFELKESLIMSIPIINPKNNLQLEQLNNNLIDSGCEVFPIINDVPRIAQMDNYTKNFGIQWNKFSKTQLDREVEGLNLSKQRFFTETHWDEVANMFKRNGAKVVFSGFEQYGEGHQVAVVRGIKLSTQ